ncbi:hypothetical protein Bca101_018502 [Brassica carinata]
MECTNSLLPFGHYYPSCLQPNLTLGLTKLSDKSFLTVLLQDHVGGLQVLHDQYWLITNGKFISVERCVLANAPGARISVACFFSSYLMAIGES